MVLDRNEWTNCTNLSPMLTDGWFVSVGVMCISTHQSALPAVAIPLKSVFTAAYLLENAQTNKQNT